MTKRKKPEPPERPDKFAIGWEFTEGFSDGITPHPWNSNKSPHWLAGYSAGYKLRPMKHEALNAYLESLGVEKMGIVRISGATE